MTCRDFSKCNLGYLHIHQYYNKDGHQQNTGNPLVQEPQSNCPRANANENMSILLLMGSAHFLANLDLHLL